MAVEIADALNVVAPDMAAGMARLLPLISNNGVPCLPALEAGLLKTAAHSSHSPLNPPLASSSLAESRLHALTDSSTAEATMLSSLPVSDRRGFRRLRLGWLRRGAVKVWL